MHFFSDPEPLGVVGVISPWNSSIILSVRAIAPALAAVHGGASPPHQTALTNALFAEAVAAVPSLPPGVLNVTETGSIGSHAGGLSADMISYTGSTNVGRTIAANGAKTLKRLNLELGGKAPLVVFDDANLAAVVPQIVMALVAMNGQFCCTGSRVLVQRTVADRLRAALVEAYGNVRLGESEDPQAQLGPLIDKASVARVDAVVAEAASYANVLVRGTNRRGTVGCRRVLPSKFDRGRRLERLRRSERGVWTCPDVRDFEDEADAIARANATEFGLAASVFSEDASRCRRVGKAIRAGHIWMNCWGVMSEQFEQSGFKQSGIGVLCGPRD